MWPHGENKIFLKIKLNFTLAKIQFFIEVYFNTGINKKSTSSRSGNSQISMIGYFPALLSACEAALIVSFHSLGFLLLSGTLIQSTYKYTLVGKLGVFVCLFVVCQVRLFCLNFTFGFLLPLPLLSQKMRKLTLKNHKIL